MSERHGRGDDPQEADEAVVRVVVGLQAKGQHAAEAGGHLLFGNLMPRIALQSRIRHEADARLLFQPAGHSHGVFVVLAHAQRQRYGPAHDEPCIEGADDAAEIDLRLRADLIQVFRLADDRAAHGVAVAIDVFGHALHHKVRAQLDGPLVEGRGKGVVHAQQCAVAVGNVRDGRNVRDHERRVARRLDMDELGVGADSRLHVGGIGGVDNGRLHAEFVVEQLIEQPVDRDVRHAGEDHMVALIQQREKQPAQRGHAGGQRDAVLPALERGDALLQVFLIRAAVARVEVGARARPVHVRGVVGQRVAVGHRDGALDGAAVLIHFVADVHGARCKLQRRFVFMSCHEDPSFRNVNIVFL